MNNEKAGNMNTFNLNDHELTVREVHRNLPPSSLYEHAIRYEKGGSIAENGATKPAPAQGTKLPDRLRQ